MLRTQLDQLLDDVLTDRRLLSHPFYRRWEAGTLAPGELAAYAGQYRHFEAALPGVLEAVLGGLDDPTARALVEGNLHDECGVPQPHLELFDGFVTAAGGDPGAGPTPATEALVSAYRELAAADPVAGLSALAAYEVQAPAIARSKADGLYAHHGMDATQARFWEVHAEMDQAHASWALDAVVASSGDDATVERAARLAAECWWAFLDDREAAGSTC